MSKLVKGVKLYSASLDWPENVFIVCDKCQGPKEAKKVCKKIDKKAKKLCRGEDAVILNSMCLGFCPKDKVAVLCSKKISRKKPESIKNKKKIKKQIEKAV